MVISCECFGPRHSPYSNYRCHPSDIVAVGTIFNVYSYDAVLSRNLNLSPPRRRADALGVEPWSRVNEKVVCYLFILNHIFGVIATLLDFAIFINIQKINNNQ